MYSEMLLHSVILTNSWVARCRRPVLSALFRHYSISAELCAPVYPRRVLPIDEDCNDFLPWLEHKAGAKISSALVIGKSSYGRSLYAAENIQTGDCLLQVPYSVQLGPGNLPPEINCLLGDEVGSVAKVALLILHERKMGKNSEWAPYISRLPLPKDMHSTIFWSDEELEMIRPCALYEETLRQKDQIERDFSAVKLVFDRFPDLFQDVTQQEFAYACGLVTSRAWESSMGVSLIPFADFLNHDGTSEAYALSDESKQHSEIIADRDFAPGDEVLIRYGRFSNATLLLDFGFTVSINCHEQVQVEFNVSQDDRIYKQKLEILDSKRTRSIEDVNEFTSSGNVFTIMKVRKGNRKGKGIPQSLRAFCRILTCSSQQELNAFAIEATRTDGRLARYPLNDKNREMEAHRYLLSEISQIIEERNRYIELLVLNPPCCSGKSAVRRKLAQDLLTGEVRVLKSAAAWLDNYCSKLWKN